MKYHQRALTSDPASPLIGAADSPGHRGAPDSAPHTQAELDALIHLVSHARPPVRAVVVGHSRDAVCTRAAAAFAEAWTALSEQHVVLSTVDWPCTAASWLRPARRFAAGDPDAWVVAAGGVGWVQMARRARHSTVWDPARTFAFAAAADAAAVALAGHGTLDGLRGATAQGGRFQIGSVGVTFRPPDETRVP
jgi:hypothetical protein